MEISIQKKEKFSGLIYHLSHFTLRFFSVSEICLNILFLSSFSFFIYTSLRKLLEKCSS